MQALPSYLNKINLTLILFMLYSQQGIADCAGRQVTVWPSDAVIAKNPVIILEGYGLSRELMDRLDKTYLSSGKTIIPLEVIKINKGQFHISQAILKPARSLTPGSIYRLVVEEYKKGVNKTYYSTYGEWTVKDEIDTIGPQWLSKPVYVCKQITYFGCGPATYVKFSGAFRDQSGVKILARVRSVRTVETTEYYISDFRIGHGMCAGEFIMAENESYEVCFSLMDASGNHAQDFTKPVRFSAPTGTDQHAGRQNCDCSDSSQAVPASSANVHAPDSTILIDHTPLLKCGNGRNRRHMEIIFIIPALILLGLAVVWFRQNR